MRNGVGGEAAVNVPVRRARQQQRAIKKRPRRYAVRMTKNITALAARNNALWCEAVCWAHDRPGEFMAGCSLPGWERRLLS